MPTNKEIKAKADEIRHWFKNVCDVNRIEHREAIKRAAAMIFNRQTIQEQDRGETVELNGRGFSGRDGGFGSRITKWNGDLTPRMAHAAKSMMTRYARQLAEIKLGIL